MAKRKIVWTKTALAQRYHILDYWVKHNKSRSYSEKLIVIFKERTQNLIENTKLGKEAEFPETRVISMGHFSIFYKIQSDIIVITALWYNRQNPDKLIIILKKSDKFD